MPSLYNCKKAKVILPFAYFLLLVIGSSKAQDTALYNKIYMQTYLETAQKDMNKALYIADSLFRISETPFFQAKSLMLSATLYQHTGNPKKAVEYAEKANSFIQETNDYDWQARIYGFLATQYRMLHLYTQSKSYVDKAFQVISRISNQEMANTTRGFMYQENAYYYINLKDYKMSVRQVYQSQACFDRTRNNSKSFLTANNEQLLGLDYYASAQYDSALYHYQKGLKLSADFPVNFITGLIYNGLAAVYLAQNRLGEAKQNLDAAGLIARESDYLQLKSEVLKTAENYYTKTNDLKNLEKTRRQQDSVEEQLSEKEASFVDDHLAKVESQSDQIKAANSMKTQMVIAAAGLLLLAVAYGLYYRHKKKKQLERFHAIIKELRAGKPEQKQEKLFVSPAGEPGYREQLTNVPCTDSPAIAKNETSPKADSGAAGAAIIPAETRRKILSGLDKFEASAIFTNQNISLSFLATHLNTNIKYLS